MSKLNRHLRSTLSTLMVLFCAGCVSLLPKSPPSKIYRLSSPDHTNGQSANGAETTILIDRLVAPRSLAGARIALQRDEAIGYMAAAVWIEPVPYMVENLVAEVMDQKAPLMVSAKAVDGLKTDYELDMNLKHFQAHYDRGEESAPLIKVSVRARLIDRSQRNLMAVHSFDVTRRANAHRQGDIVEAFSSASTDLAFEITDWVGTEICTHKPSLQAC